MFTTPRCIERRIGGRWSFKSIQLSCAEGTVQAGAPKHCCRRTRGTEETLEAIESLLLALSDATDALGMPLLREEMKDIWEEQRHHVKCIQDPPSVQLYTEIARLVKGGVSLPVYRCARGSTSLESFHLHLAR